MSECQRNATQLSNKQRRNGFVQCRTVHIDCGTDRNDKACNAWINAHRVQTVDGNWHRCRTGTGTKSGGQYLTHLSDISERKFVHRQKEYNGNCTEPVNHQTQHNGQEIHSKLSDHFGKRTDFENFRCNQKEYADR